MTEKYHFWSCSGSEVLETSEEKHILRAQKSFVPVKKHAKHFLNLLDYEAASLILKETANYGKT